MEVEAIMLSGISQSHIDIEGMFSLIYEIWDEKSMKIKGGLLWIWNNKKGWGRG